MLQSVPGRKEKLAEGASRFAYEYQKAAVQKDLAHASLLGLSNANSHHNACQALQLAARLAALRDPPSHAGKALRSKRAWLYTMNGAGVRARRILRGFDWGLPAVDAARPHLFACSAHLRSSSNSGPPTGQLKLQSPPPLRSCVHCMQEPAVVPEATGKQKLNFCTCNLTCVGLSGLPWQAFRRWHCTLG